VEKGWVRKGKVKESDKGIDLRGNEKELMRERIGKGIDLRRNWMVLAITKLFNLRLESADSRKTRVG
jgi:hypothetical protein